MNPAAPVTTMRLLAGMDSEAPCWSVYSKNPVDRVRGGTPLDHVRQDNPPTAGFNNLTPTDVVGPILTLHQDLRLNLRNQVDRLVFTEYDNVIDNPEGGQHISTIILAVNGTCLAFVALDGCVRIHSHNQRIALTACKR